MANIAQMVNCAAIHHTDRRRNMVYADLPCICIFKPHYDSQLLDTHFESPVYRWEERSFAAQHFILAGCRGEDTYLSCNIDPNQDSILP